MPRAGVHDPRGAGRRSSRAPRWIRKSRGEQTAVLAGGCFWGVEAVFEALTGVKDVVSGYAGGSKSSANYRVVSSGTTGHAESVRITYDPAKICTASC